MRMMLAAWCIVAVGCSRAGAPGFDQGSDGIGPDPSASARMSPGADPNAGPTSNDFVFEGTCDGAHQFAEVQIQGRTMRQLQHVVVAVHGSPASLDSGTWPIGYEWVTGQEAFITDNKVAIQCFAHIDRFRVTLPGVYGE